MMSVFEIFKIVLGLVIGGFFLYFAVQFGGLYSATETKSAEVQEYRNLQKLIEDTYIYDVPSEIGLKKPPQFASPPFISEGAGVSVNPSILFFFRPGTRLHVYKGTLNYGFWKQDFVGAIPETKVFYGITDYTLEHYSIINNITELFPQSADPVVSFGFCNGDSELVSKSRDEFLRPIRGIIRAKSPQDLGLEPCTAGFNQPKTKIVVASADSEIPLPENGFIVRPFGAGQMGSVEFRRADKEGKTSEYRLVYKDQLDIFAAIIGGVDSYKYKNKLMFESLLLFSKGEARRAALLANTFIDPELRKEPCIQIYNNLKSKMDGEFGVFLESLISLQNYNNPVEMEKFLGLMDELNGIYFELKNNGCE